MLVRASSFGWQCRTAVQSLRAGSPDSIAPTPAAAQVIDFGLSHAADDAAAPCLGTPEYIAPETLVGAQAGDVSARPAPHAVDIWGAGIVLYMLVAGRYPFQVCGRGCCQGPGGLPFGLYAGLFDAWQGAGMTASGGKRSCS